jgi:hypothetical protein
VLTMDAPEVQLLAVVAHNVAADDVHENFDAIASSHHRTQSEVSVSVESRRRRIEHMMNLMFLDAYY